MQTWGHIHNQFWAEPLCPGWNPALPLYIYLQQVYRQDGVVKMSDLASTVCTLPSTTPGRPVWQIEVFPQFYSLRNRNRKKIRSCSKIKARRLMCCNSNPGNWVRRWLTWSCHSTDTQNQTRKGFWLPECGRWHQTQMPWQKWCCQLFSGKSNTDVL